MSVRKLFFFYLLFCVAILSAQSPIAKKSIPISCDCNAAHKLVLTKPYLFGETLAPEGFGAKQEIKASKQNPIYTFEKEHNSAWYKLVIKVDGNLCFDIMPEKGDDDYDFMLFRSYSDSLLCDSIAHNLVKPVRANISRDKKEIKGWTGIRASSDKELIKEGVGEAFSKSIEVKKGQVYYLVLDNVYPKGLGHKINFYFGHYMELSGTVTDNEGKPIKAEITISDNKGVEILKEFSNEKTGDYAIKGQFEDNKQYNMTIYNDSLFIDSKIITTKTEKAKLQNIKIVLPKLKKGNKYRITSINFYGGEDRYIPSSLSSIEALYKLMKKNSALKIQIEGHTNGCGLSPPHRTAEELSKDRAWRIKDYLTEKGIESVRIQTIGYGCSKMLYPVDGSSWEQEQNRRVEINVLNY